MEIRKIQYLKLSVFLAVVVAVSIDSLLLSLVQIMNGFPILDSERGFSSVSLYFLLNSW